MPLVLRNLSKRKMDFEDNALDIESSLCMLTFCRDSVATAFSARSAFRNLAESGKALRSTGQIKTKWPTKSKSQKPAITAKKQSW